MKTKLPQAITSIDDAKKFLSELHKNSESYHPEDDAHKIDWVAQRPTIEECDQLNKLMNEIYELPGNEDSQKMIFDPCQFLIDQDEQI